MKLAVSNIGWAAEHDETILPLLKQAGADAIEVAPGRLFPDPAAATPAQAADIAGAYARAGLPVVSMQALLFGQNDLRLFGEDLQAQALQSYLGHIFRLAGALGCGPLVFGSPRNRARGDLSFEEAAARALPVFRSIGDAARATGTVFCLEANARGYGCDFMTTIAEATDMAARVGHPGVAIVADTGNMIMEAEPPKAVLAAMAHIRHVHISAPHLGPVTEHTAYIKDVLTHVTGAGYDGDITLEMRPPDTDHPVGTLLQNVTFLRDLIDGLAA